LGSIAAVLLLMLRSMTYSATVQATSQQLRSYSGLLDSIKCELDRFSENRYDSGTGELPASFEINVKNVSFAYDERGTVLREVSFYLPSGQILGIAGRSGSGKTTLSTPLHKYKHVTTIT